MNRIHIEGADLPPLHLEGCTQTITQDDQGGLRRTVNGAMAMTAADTRIRYMTTLQCAGPGVPTFGNLQIGQQVRIHCIQRLWQKGQKKGVRLERPAVEKSVMVLNSQQNIIPHDQLNQTVIPRLLGRPYFVGYCPILTVCITHINMSCGVGGLNQVWTLTAEEAF